MTLRLRCSSATIWRDNTWNPSIHNRNERYRSRIGVNICLLGEAAMNSPPISATPPNPYAPTFRPSPARAATLSAGLSFKSRATSQPAGDRTSAVSSYPEPGRGSSGNGSGGAFGVIGGSRTPARHGNVLGTGGVATRANSFSAGEHWERRVRLFPSTVSTRLTTAEFLIDTNNLPSTILSCRGASVPFPLNITIPYLLY